MECGTSLRPTPAIFTRIDRAGDDWTDYLAIDDLEPARLAQKAETDFVGAPVGIMDQMACSLADQSSALLIDTRTLDYSRVELPPASALLVIDSGERLSHVTGGYRHRRAD